jgi:multisubunit Na+/H+ antiporter MnhB subunit
MNMAAKMDTILRNKSGAALVIALIMIVVITLIALASSYTSIFEIKMSGNKRGSTDAFYAADAGTNVITSYPMVSFSTTAYTVLVASTSSWYDPFYLPNTTTPNPNIPNPTSIPPGTSTNPTITYYMNQSGQPRGGGYSAVNVSYAYFQVQCTGNDTAGSGAQAKVQEDVIELVPIPQ